MSVSRIKTIVIAALVLLNAFFGTFILIDTAADARVKRQAIENTCAVLRSGGIMIEPDAIVVNRGLRAMRTAREDKVEALIAQAVLGEMSINDLGMISTYENEGRGKAEFYSGGDFEIQLLEGVKTNENGSLKAVQELLRSMGLETTSQTVSPSPEGETVTVVGAYKGVSIFNCTTEFVFVNGSLRTVKGRYIAGLEPVGDSKEAMQVGTVLLGFLAWLRSENIECTQISKVEAGYQHSVSGSFGEGTITPAWRITTDTGKYIVDG